MSAPDPLAQFWSASNPATGARGMVPREMFESFGPSAAAARGGSLPLAQVASPSVAASSASPAASGSAKNGTPKPASKPPTLCAFVKFDFEAARVDELTCKKGEAIVVIAQYNHEWLVAKSIENLGGPGLIPVTFVDIHDPVTGKPVVNVSELFERDLLPKLDQWKASKVAYQKSAISLGQFDSSALPPVQSPYPSTSLFDMQNSSPSMSQAPFGSPMPASSSLDELPEAGLVTQASVVSWHVEDDQYWFQLMATFTLDHDSTPEPTEIRLKLFRTYPMFYDFQITLLAQFMVEAGRIPDPAKSPDSPATRILPYMMGPDPDGEIDKPISLERRMIRGADEFTSRRTVELNEYIGNIVRLPQYIRRHPLCRAFFSPKPGDNFQRRPIPSSQLQSPNLSSQARSRQQSSEDPQTQTTESLANQLSGLRMAQDAGASSQNLSASPYQDISNSRVGSSDELPERNMAQDDEETLVPQSAALRNTRTPAGNLPPINTTFSNQSGYNPSQQTSHFSAPSNRDTFSSSGGIPQSSTSSSFQVSSGPSPISPALRRPLFPTQNSNLSAMTSMSTASGTSGTTPSFIKIKIFRQSTDDLIAIRVSPRVSLGQLFEKVSERFSLDVDFELCYRDSNNVDIPVLDEQSLATWLSTTDKYVLFIRT